MELSRLCEEKSTILSECKPDAIGLATPKKKPLSIVEHPSDLEQKPPTLSESQSNASNPDSQRQKIHPAIEYFYQLRQKEPSIQLEKYLSNFDVPRAIDSKIFTKGVKKFIQLANSNPVNERLKNNRKQLYGNVYSGLHYNNDLVKLWNASHLGEESLKAFEVDTLAPSAWESTLQDGYKIFIYKGQQPAQALDELVKGPTVIDCGMFTQLSFWFGIRYMLGNKRFNQCFGRTPFFITQSVYNEIKFCDKPYLGNPLYSFLSTKEDVLIPSVKHLTNSPLYRFKHPGGNYGGENCIVIDEDYYIFDPHLENTQGISKTAVLDLLRLAFNDERTTSDTERLLMYVQHSEEYHSRFHKTYGELFGMAEGLRGMKLSEEKFFAIKQDDSLELAFDLHKFSSWLEHIENKEKIDLDTYLPLPIDTSVLPVELLEVIPFENKTSMDFSKFKEETPQQKELMALSKQFCHSVMENESKLVILSGKAGVGKTASAVCSAKELTARGKKVVWISEVMVNGWADQAKSIADIAKCGLEIDNLLAKNPDAVFLDDDNLTGFSGQLLLEKMYSWYIKHPGKGLFITSNEPICFENCYGHKLDDQFHYPPFTPYNSPQYLNWQHKSDLGGESLRSRRDGQSIGAIVSQAYWQKRIEDLREFELVPAFNEDKELAPIRRALKKTGSMNCPAYDKLLLVQKRWIHKHQVGPFFKRSRYVKPYLTVNVSPFEKTTHKTIVLEMGESNSSYFGKSIDPDTMEQLIRILNYAHDKGGRRIIFINQTSFSHEELLAEIKKELPKSERERTWSRLMLLLCETEESIFNHDQFNGHVEAMAPGKTYPESSKDGVIDEIDKIIDPSILTPSIKRYFFKPLVTPESKMEPAVLDDSFLFSPEGMREEREEHSISELRKLALDFSQNLRAGFFSTKKTELAYDSDIPESKEKVKKHYRVERGSYRGQVFNKHDEFLIQHRHDDVKLQQEYDKKFGMIVMKNN